MNWVECGGQRAQGKGQGHCDHTTFFWTHLGNVYANYDTKLFLTFFISQKSTPRRYVCQKHFSPLFSSVTQEGECDRIFCSLNSGIQSQYGNAGLLVKRHFWAILSGNMNKNFMTRFLLNPFLCAELLDETWMTWWNEVLLLCRITIDALLSI